MVEIIATYLNIFSYGRYGLSKYYWPKNTSNGDGCWV